MKQPVKKNINIPKSSKKTTKKYYKKRKVFKKSNDSSDQDGSGLEAYFRINFLDKLNLNYDQQFEAKDIGRFYDFHLKDKDNNSLMILLEIDGSYFHCDPRIYSKPISSTQKHNIRVDKLKNEWALLHSFCLIRIWEQDIRNDSKKVMNLLLEHIGLQDKRISLNESKKDGSFFMKKN